MLDKNELKVLNLEGFAIVRKDGLLVDGILPDYIEKETFSIMCATIYMGSVSAYNELHLKGPDRIILNGFDMNLVILPKDQKEMWVIILSSSVNIEETIKNFLEKIK